MDLKELHRVSKKSIQSAGARYTPHLDPNAPNLEIADLLQSIHALARDAEYARTLQNLSEAIQLTGKDIAKTFEEYSTGDKYQFFKLRTAINRLRNSRPKKNSTIASNLVGACKKYRKSIENISERIRAEERDLARKKTEIISDKPTYTSGNDRISQLQAKTNDLSKHSSTISELLEYLSSSGVLIERNCALILGTWGTGKTHFLCDVTNNRLALGLPTLLVLAKDFSVGTDALTALCSSTRLSSNIDDLLSNMNNLGAQTAQRALLILDGINESDRNEWRKSIRILRNKVKSYPYLGLVVSCRRPFEGALFPKKYSQQYVVLMHRGFTDREFDAQTEFFRFYKLPLPEIPLLAEEFSRPLTLKIICEAFANLPSKSQARGFESLTSGQRGMTFVLEQYVKQQAKEVERLTGFSSDACWWLLKGGKQAGISRTGIAPLMAETLREFITTTECLNLIRAHLPKGKKGKAHKVLNALCAAGILAEDFVWHHKDEGGPIEIIRLPYQRFSDHLIARSLLSHLNTSNGIASIRDSFKSDKPLGRVFSLNTGIYQYAMPGWAEALMVEFPERTKNVLPDNKRELLAYLPKSQRDLNAYFEPFLGGLFWRHPSSIGHDTDKLVGIYFFSCSNETAALTADVMVALGSKKKHPYSAKRLYSNLARMTMVERDLRWSEYLRKNHPITAMEKVVQWIESHPTKVFGEDTASNLIVLLSLGLTTTDRLLRDRITKCLVYLGETAPSSLFEHAILSLSFNDPYVAERVLAAAFGVCMSLWRVPGQTEFNKNLSDFALKLVKFMFIAGAPYGTHHELRRDYALGIIEIAKMQSPSSIPNRWKKYLERPFKSISSPFPKVDSISDADCEDGISAIHMDFRNYTIGGLVDGRQNYDDKNPSYIKIKRQIEWRIGNLGYKKSAFGEIDRDLGRSDYYREQRDNSKIDRYGKKYSWIAYFEMYGWLEARSKQKRLRRGDPRPAACDIDPSFPEPSPSWTPTIDSVFIKRYRKSEKWLAEGPVPNFRPLLVQQNIGSDIGPWVLLNGYVSVEEPIDGREVFTFLRGVFVSPRKLNQLKRAYLDIEYPGNREIPEVNGGYYTFAGEIPWAKCFSGSPRGNSEPRPYEDFAFEKWGTRNRKVIIKNAWAKLYSLIAPDEFSALIKKIYAESKSKPDLPCYSQFTSLIDAANVGLVPCEQFVPGDFSRIPSISEALQGFFLEKRSYKKGGVKVENPSWRYEWESHHSQLNNQGGAEMLSPSICYHLNLSFQRRSFDLCDLSGHKATLYRSSDGANDSRSYALFLREDLLQCYLANRNKKLVWMIWGERAFRYPESENMRDKPENQLAWEKHLHIHRAFEQYPLQN